MNVASCLHETIGHLVFEIMTSPIGSAIDPSFLRKH